MKKSIFYYFLLVAVFLNAYQTRCFAQAATYTLDINKSKLYWQGTKTVGTKHTGTVLCKSGSLNVNADGNLSGGEFVMDMNSISSNDHKLKKDNLEVDEQLKGETFFSVAMYPTSALKIIKMEPTEVRDQFRVTGSLTIRNITRQITFLALIKPVGTRLNATADLIIDRIKWGIHEKKDPNLMWSIQNAMMSDDIPIRLSLEFAKN